MKRVRGDRRTTRSGQHPRRPPRHREARTTAQAAWLLDRSWWWWLPGLGGAHDMKEEDSRSHSHSHSRHHSKPQRKAPLNRSASFLHPSCDGGFLAVVHFLVVSPWAEEPFDDQERHSTAGQRKSSGGVGVETMIVWIDDPIDRLIVRSIDRKRSPVLLRSSCRSL